MGYIYKITNLVNGKAYIGKTTFTIERRFQQHKEDYKKEINKNRPLYKAMNKYGIKNFIIEEIGNYSDEQLNEKEIEYIKFFDTYYNGYNATLGGDGTSRINKEEIYLLWEQGLRPLEIARKIKKDGDVNRIRDILCCKYGEDFISKEILNRYKKSTLIKIKCYSKDTNIFIKDFDSIKDGANWVWQNGYTKGSIDSAASLIGKCCKGIKPSAYGFIWKKEEN